MAAGREQFGKNLLSNPYLIFGFLWIVAMITFFPARHAGLVYDFIGWQEAYDQGTWVDIIHCFGYKGMHQVLHLFFYAFYRLLGTNAIGWYVLFTTFHAFLGFLVYVWLRKIQETYGFRLFSGAALAGALFVLLHPHSTEVVIWKVCIHYILSGIWLTGIMILYLDFVKTGIRKRLYWLWFLYAVSLFTLEVSYIYPAVMLLMVLTYAVQQKSISVFLNHLKAVIVPMFLILAAHLLLNRATLGSWVGHYGAEVHLNPDLLTIAANELKYLIKHLALLRFSTFQVKVAVFDTLSNPLIAFQVLLGLLVVAVFWAIRLHRFRIKTKMAFLGLFGFFLLILPVANMFFYHLMLAPNDRFGYVATILLSLFILVLIDAIPTRIKYFFLSIWLGLNIYFQQKLVHAWKDSNIIFESLIEDFRWYDRDEIINLALPDNYNGLLIYSVIDEPSGFKEVLEYNRRQKFEGTMYDVYLYNMMTLNDGVSVNQVGPDRIKVEFNQWGNWWFYNGIGAGNYENEYYKVVNEGHHYILEVKEPARDATFIYQDGLSLKEFKFDPGWKAENGG